MEIILLEKIPNLGDLGDQVKVKAGYARNYLVPHKKAVLATAEAKASVEERRIELAKLADDKLAEAKARAAKAPKSIQLTRRASDEGKLYGSVSTADIAEALSTEQLEFARAEVNMPEGAIKECGEFEVELILHPEVRFSLAVTVVAEEGE